MVQHFDVLKQRRGIFRQQLPPTFKKTERPSDHQTTLFLQRPEPDLPLARWHSAGGPSVYLARKVPGAPRIVNSAMITSFCAKGIGPLMLIHST